MSFNGNVNEVQRSKNIYFFETVLEALDVLTTRATTTTKADHCSLRLLVYMRAKELNRWPLIFPLSFLLFFTSDI